MILFFSGFFSLVKVDGTPAASFDILTEGGNSLTTEGGDNLVTQAAP